MREDDELTVDMFISAVKLFILTGGSIGISLALPVYYIEHNGWDVPH